MDFSVQKIHELYDKNQEKAGIGRFLLADLLFLSKNETQKGPT